MIRTRTLLRLVAGVGLTLGLVGCAKDNANTPTAGPPAAEQPKPQPPKISPEDQALIDAQGWCAVSTEEKLGEMGPPIKLEIKGQPVKNLQGMW